MAEYIEREAIKYELWSVGPLNEPLMVVRKKTIDRIPAADVAPARHGRWHRCGRNLGECSNCGEIVNIRYNYCPNCGCKMLEDSDGKK